MPYSSYFNNPYLNDVYLQTPDHPMNTLFDSDSFYDQSLTSIDMVPVVPKSQATFNPALLATGTSDSSNNQSPLRQMFTPAPFGQLQHYPFNPIPTQPNEPDFFSPTTEATSRAPSPSGDTLFQTISPSLSRHMLKRTSPSPSSPTSGSDSSTPKRPTRKRGRPKPNRNNIDTSTTSSSTLTSPTTTSSSAIIKVQRSKRLPHNQVERKYREGLNSELERLRRTVPILRREDGETGALGHPRPSKAMVLSSAIEYIQRIEKERDVLREENKRLRRGQRVGGEGKSWDMSGGDV